MPKRITQEKQEAIRTLLTTTELTHTQISAEVGVSSVTVDKYAKKFLSEEERKARIFKMCSNAKSRDKHPQWKGEEHSYVDKQGGYRWVRAPEWWTGSKKRGSYTLEHRVVYAAKKGLTCIPDGYVIHHVDGNRLNNHPLNLVMMKHWVHAALHKKLEAKGENK